MNDFLRTMCEYITLFVFFCKLIFDCGHPNIEKKHLFRCLLNRTLKINNFIRVNLTFKSSSHLLFHHYDEKYAIPNMYFTIEQGTSTPSQLSAAHRLYLEHNTIYHIC